MIGKKPLGEGGRGQGKSSPDRRTRLTGEEASGVLESEKMYRDGE